MKKPVGLLIFLLAAVALHAEPPNFDYAYFVTSAEGYIMEDNLYTIPCFGDWDDDGDADLMVGVLFYGNIYYYENVSTGIEPLFAPGALVMANGSPISVSYG